MNIKSLSYSTMLNILSFNSEVIDRDEYIVIKTPSNPHHHWGNFLMFPSSPIDGDFEFWRKLFTREFGHSALIRHMAFAWDSTEDEAGIIEPFIEAGYTFELDDVFTAVQLHLPPNYNSEITIRQIVNDEDWEKICKLRIYCDGKEEDNDYVEFVQKRMQAFRKISEMGLGAWFGAFIAATSVSASGGKDKLVADVGLYTGGGTLGRFRLPETHPGHRKKGICGTLLFHTSEYGFNEMGFEKLVIVADRAYHAGKAYRSVGFEVTEYGASLISKITQL